MVIILKTVAERFLEYVTFETTSRSDSNRTPSTEGQLVFAEALAEECSKIGLSNVSVSQYGYVYAQLPANTDKQAPTIGFIAHMDTSEDCCGKDVKARIVSGYDGSDITLNESLALTPDEFPSLNGMTGKDLIVTDGTTLLGADNKAGIAIILTFAEHLLNHPEIKHGKIMIGFTPDEEIGKGANEFDVTGFGADFAYTVDGGGLGEFEIETFNAAIAAITINGKTIHPGKAKGIMINSALFLPGLINAFPPDETPAHTEGRQGFYHLLNIKAGCEKTEVSYIIRDHNKKLFEKRKAYFTGVIDGLNTIHGEGRFSLDITEQYLNMIEVLKDHPEVAELAREAISKAGIEIRENPVRGGTDGSRLTFMGLPCPNIFTGGYNAHGPYEFVCIQEMEKAVEVVVNIAKIAVPGEDTADADAETAALNEKLAALNAEIAASNAEIAVPNAEIADANAEIAALNEEIAALYEEIAVLYEDLSGE